MAEAPVVPRPSRGVWSVLGVFALGIVFGAALVVVLGHLRDLHHPFGHGEGIPPHAERLIREFGLEPEQEKQVRAILLRSRDEIHGVLENAHGEIRALLTPEQQRKLDRMHLPHGRRGRGRPGRETSP
jgi:hypothetical protein